MKKLSIITICYNEPFLEKTCESIVNQTWQDFEWVVVDGGSNQETLDIFEKYKSRIDKFISEPDNGIYDGCNKGVKLAEGEFVIFMNAGDCFYSNTILAKVFENKTYSADILYGDTQVLDNNTHQEVRISKQPSEMTKDYLILSNLDTQSVFIRRELFNKCGLHDLNYKIASDYDRWLAFYKGGTVFEYLQEIISCYDNSGISSNPKNQNKMDTERYKIVRKYFSEDEIKEAIQNSKDKYTFIEQVFSIKTSEILKNNSQFAYCNDELVAIIGDENNVSSCYESDFELQLKEAIYFYKKYEQYIKKSKYKKDIENKIKNKSNIDSDDARSLLQGGES